MTTPVAWQAGYDWACSRGDFAEMDCGDAIEAHGWDFMSKEFDMFLAGAKCAQNEIAEDMEQ
ncbi:MAG: hypothetical protein ABF990_12045 [Acetobacter sp.]|uniref:hypothetical protein n=1 Tax=Acetobacter sp. TaxID=440 RepID=UPI0039E7800C